MHTTTSDLIKLPGIVIPENATIESLKAAGEYDLQTDCAEECLTDKYFKVSVTGCRSLYIIHFNEVINNKCIESAIRQKRHNMKMALIEDLLAIGSSPEYRELQLQFPIVALGSFTNAIIRDGKHAPCLDNWGNKRDLHLEWCCDDKDWRANFRFLLVGEESL